MLKHFRLRHNPIQLPKRPICVDTQMGINIMVGVMAITTFLYILAFIMEDDFVVECANKYLPLALVVTSAYVVYKRLQHNFLFLWSPETWFYIFSAIEFGMGAVIYFYGSEDFILSAESIYPVRGLLLLRTNILNSVTILLVSLVFLFFPKYYYINQPDKLVISNTLWIKQLCIYFGVMWGFLLLPSLKFQLPGAFGQLGAGILSSLIVILFFLWSRGDRKMAKWALMLLAAMTFLTVAGFGKTNFLENFMYAAIGIFMAKGKINIKHVVLGGIVLTTLLVWYMPIAEFGRREGIQDDPFQHRFNLTTQYIFGKIYSNRETESNSIYKLWARHNLSNVQGFLMEQYDRGRSGSSFRDIWVFFIPRVLWSGKPITTSVSREFNELFFGNTGSQLAPSFNGDAYWNGGWIMVCIVGLYIGVLFSFMSRLSLEYIGNLDFRFMPIAIWIMNLGRYTEGFFASAFIGGVVIMAAWWLVLKRILPNAKRVSSKQMM